MLEIKIGDSLNTSFELSLHKAGTWLKPCFKYDLNSDSANNLTYPHFSTCKLCKLEPKTLRCAHSSVDHR